MPADAEDLEVLIQLRLVAEGGEQEVQTRWIRATKANGIESGAGEVEKPHLTIRMTAEDYDAIRHRRLKVTQAFRDGRLHVRGQLQHADRLADLLMEAE